ncbi:hypothetical protein COCNU_contig69096982G000010 [Cocos nucifera]|nr:hypothetical protein [Cocos nucifera]
MIILIIHWGKLLIIRHGGSNTIEGKGRLMPFTFKKDRAATPEGKGSGSSRGGGEMHRNLPSEEALR